MAKAYRYPLTRVCLRGGTMTLPLAMLQLFPEDGQIVAVDNETGEEYALELTSPRVLAGLGDLYAAHDLEVNDELHVAPLGGGRFGFDVVSRTKRSASTQATALVAILDELATAGVPATEAEVHALYPTLPLGFDVTPYLAADPRFELRNGRWQSAAAEAPEAEEAPEPARLSATVTAQVTELVEVAAGGAAVTAASDAAAQAQHGADRPAADTQQPALWGAERGSEVWQGFAASAERGTAYAEAGALPHDRASAPRQVHERRTPDRQAPVGGGAERDEREPNGGDLVIVELAQRLRTMLEPLGFRIVPLGGGQVTLVADLGRRNYQVHVQLLPTGERLDWASLLAKRRSSTARYLAVIGDHRDLLRLTSPAELARATLWSWEGLERLRVLHGTVPVSPIDLESHFERDGLFESGLQRFEQGVAARVAERGATSEVLTRLANLRAPTVFLLEELATDAGMSRESVLRILERLAEAPFHLVARVDQGEFLLRMRVADALTNIGAYAASLRERLPVRKHERLTGLDDDVDAATSDGAAEVAEADADEAGLGGALKA